MDDAIGIDIEGNLNLRNSTRSSRNLVQGKGAEDPVLGSHLTFALQDLDADLGLAISRSSENLALVSRNRGVARNHLGAHAAEGLDAQGKRSDIKQDDVLDGSAKNTTLNGGAHGDYLIRVDTLHRLLAAEHLLDCFLDRGDTGRATNKNDLVDIVDRQASITQRIGDRTTATLDQVGGHGLEVGPGKIHLQVQRAVVLVGDERQADGVVHRAGKSDLRLLRLFLHPLQGHGIVLQVDAILRLELLVHPIDDLRIEVITAKVGITVGALDFENAVSELQDGDIEGTAAEVIDGNLLFLVGLVQAVGQSAGGRLVDDTLHIKAGDLSCVLGGLALGIVEIGRDRDDRLGHRLLQIGLRSCLHLLKDGGGNLLRRVFLALGDDTDIALSVAGHLIRQSAQLLLDISVLILVAHETLD